MPSIWPAAPSTVIDSCEQRECRGVQSAARVDGGPLEEFLALLIRHAVEQDAVR
jgi:hypothetical protein